MNLPNALSLARIVLVPLLVVVLLTHFEGRAIIGLSKEYIAAAIFLVASLTDWLDGYLARSRDQVTALGQWLDPLADKLLIVAALVSLVQMGRAPAWMVALIIGRELAVTGLRSVAQLAGHSMPASSLGKLKMTMQVVAILLLILGQRLGPFAVLGHLALWAVLALAVWSAIDYYVAFSRSLAAPAPPPPTRGVMSREPGPEHVPGHIHGSDDEQVKALAERGEETSWGRASSI